MDNLERPIGIFDSGIGGLTVARHIMEVLPDEKIIYFGDTARVPYGNKSRETIERFAREDIEFLMNFDVKAIVAACFTVSSNALERIKGDYSIPIIGMIDPGVQEVLEAGNLSRIGVIGTTATIESKAYENALKRKLDVEIYAYSCPLFVPLAEEGWIEHPATYMIAEEYLRPMKENRVEAVILGCTHYPILKGVIQKVMGEDVLLLEPGLHAGMMLRKYLEEKDLLSSNNGGIEIYLSDIPRKFNEIIDRFLGGKRERVLGIEKVSPFQSPCR